MDQRPNLPEREKQPIKKPEFIIIENTREYLEHHKRKEEPGEEPTEEPQENIAGVNIRASLFIRICCALAAIICFWMTIGYLIMSAVAFVLAAILLFQQNDLNAVCKKFWSLFKVFLVCIIGSLIGIFNPTLGIGLMMIYFSLKSDAISPVMNTLLKRMSERL